MAMVKIYDKEGNEKVVHSVDANEAIKSGVWASTSIVPVEKAIDEAQAEAKVKEFAKSVMIPEKTPADIEKPKRAYNKKDK